MKAGSSGLVSKKRKREEALAETAKVREVRKEGYIENFAYFALLRALCEKKFRVKMQFFYSYFKKWYKKKYGLP